MESLQTAGSFTFVAGRRMRYSRARDGNQRAVRRIHLALRARPSDGKRLARPNASAAHPVDPARAQVALTAASARTPERHVARHAAPGIATRPSGDFGG